MVKNPNHPRSGSKTTVDPIRDLDAIKAIKKNLSGNAMYYCLFTIGLNTALRASDLCRLTAGDVRDKKVVDIKEKKTSKIRKIDLNNKCVDSIKKLLASRPYRDDEQLFYGQRGGIKPNSINKLVKAWTDAVNLSGNFGSHSLRKSWGYHQFVNYKIPLHLLMIAFNHSSERQTSAYIGVQPNEIADIYKNEL